MELPGSSYLYALATISITFAGFAAMIVILRQVVSGSLVNYDLYFIRAVLMRSFIVVACAMLPPMLALFKLSDLTIWRSSGLIAGLIQGVFILTWKKRRSAVTDVPPDNWAYAHVIFQTLTAIFLILTALGIFFEPGPGPFAVGVTAFLFSSGTAYLNSLKFLLQERPSKKRHK
jgi:hypothetical protein